MTPSTRAIHMEISQKTRKTGISEKCENGENDRKWLDYKPPFLGERKWHFLELLLSKVVKWAPTMLSSSHFLQKFQKSLKNTLFPLFQKNAQNSGLSTFSLILSHFFALFPEIPSRNHFQKTHFLHPAATFSGGPFLMCMKDAKVTRKCPQVITQKVT